MATSIIPEQKIVTCDICLMECNKAVPRLQNGVLLLNSDALDYHNHPCASANQQFDLCDSCLKAVSEAINNVTKARRLK